MYEGTVIKSFLDKNTGKVHLVRSIYQSDDFERMRELAQLGRIAFEEPPAREEKGKVEKPSTAGDSVTAQQGDRQEATAEERPIGAEPGEAEETKKKRASSKG